MISRTDTLQRIKFFRDILLELVVGVVIVHVISNAVGVSHNLAVNLTHSSTRRMMLFWGATSRLGVVNDFGGPILGGEYHFGRISAHTTTTNWMSASHAWVSKTEHTRTGPIGRIFPSLSACEPGPHPPSKGIGRQQQRCRFHYFPSVACHVVGCHRHENVH